MGAVGVVLRDRGNFRCDEKIRNTLFAKRFRNPLRVKTSHHHHGPFTMIGLKKVLPFFEEDGIALLGNLIKLKVFR